MSSATTQALRTSLRRATSCRRLASSSTFSAPAVSSSSSSPSSSKLDVRPKAELPAEKMRILVDLYHQSGNFITKENLSKAIDQAFIYNRIGYRSQLKEETPRTALETEIEVHHRSPKFAPRSNVRAMSPSKNVQDNMNWDWSYQRGPREAAVMSTLYGVTNGKGEPQYDALVDGYKTIKEDIEKEREQKEREQKEREQKESESA